jgi:phosphoribosylaminoimidazole-succinocarboxamide synthase
VKHVASGKVREIYDLDEQSLLIVTSDRMSAFDVVMNEPIPDRGRVLTGITEFWLRELAADLPNHLVSVDVPDVAKELPDVEGRTMVVRKADILPVEFIIRGYLAGSGWKEYRESGTLHGKALPGGLQLGSQLPEPVLTPSTKAELGQHDVNITWEEAAEQIGADVMKEAEALAMEMYRRGSEHARERGLILADTKFELGYIDGTLSLCDEILTPDSSRYWPTSGWSLGETPPAYDKQLLRDWLEEQQWDKTPPPPALPVEIVAAVRQRYVDAYERLTERTFTDWPGVSG